MRDNPFVLPAARPVQHFHLMLGTPPINACVHCIRRVTHCPDCSFPRPPESDRARSQPVLALVAQFPTGSHTVSLRRGATPWQVFRPTQGPTGAPCEACGTTIQGTGSGRRSSSPCDGGRSRSCWCCSST